MPPNLGHEKGQGPPSLRGAPAALGALEGRQGHLLGAMALAAAVPEVPCCLCSGFRGAIAGSPTGPTVVMGGSSGEARHLHASACPSHQASERSWWGVGSAYPQGVSQSPIFLRGPADSDLPTLPLPSSYQAWPHPPSPRVCGWGRAWPPLASYKPTGSSGWSHTAPPGLRYSWPSSVWTGSPGPWLSSSHPRLSPEPSALQREQGSWYCPGDSPSPGQP